MPPPHHVDAASGSMNCFQDRFRDASVLVTGHTGFKGSWLCRWLLKCGARVHGYALDPTPEATLYDQLELAEQLTSDWRRDIRDANQLRRAITEFQPQYVFHLAAQPLVRKSYQNPTETIAINVMGSTYLLDALRTLRGPCTAIIVTTDKCYANREWLHGYRECDPLGGKDPYSASKAAAELVTACYRNSYFNEGPVRIASVRAGNVIGGGDWAADRIVPDCIRALRNGESIAVRNRHSTRPWQHVLEPLSGYLWLAACLQQQTVDSLTDPVGDKYEDFRLDSAFNFGPQLCSNRTVEDLVRQIIVQYGSGSWRDESDPKAEYEAGRLDLAISKAHHRLGWQPVWDFEETVRQTVQWYGCEQEQRGIASVTDEQICQYVAAAQSLPWADDRRSNATRDQDGLQIKAA